MFQVKFNSPEEFVAELRLDSKRVRRHIVRSTLLRTINSPMVRFTVVATALVDSSVVSLRRVVGECLSCDDQSYEDLVKKAQKMRQDLDKQMLDLGLKIRGGIFE